MIDTLFNKITLHDFHDDVKRNIKSIREPQDLFNDLSDDPDDWTIATGFEMETKPDYRSPPVIHRPFDESDIFNAIEYPFKHWTETRYSDGTFGVWYGAGTAITSIHETHHHWLRFLGASDLLTYDEPIVGERIVFNVRLDAALLNFRPLIADFPDLIADDYSFTKNVGQRLHNEGHPGLISNSAHCEGEIFAVFNEKVLSNPRHACYLTYVYNPETRLTIIEREVGSTLIEIQS